MRASLVLAASLAVAASSPAQAQAAAATRSLVLDATRSGPTINRDVFGQFAEHLGQGIYGGVWVGPNSKIPNVRGIRTDVVQALRALKVPVAGPEAASLTHTIGAMGSARPASARRP